MSFGKLAKTVTLVVAMSAVVAAADGDGSADAAPADHTSTVDVNEHHQNGTFEDADHDIIEDYSVDKDLEQAEKQEQQEEKKEVKEAAVTGGPMGGLGAFGIDDDILNHEDGYTEESTDAQGHHIKKTLHKGNGFSSVQVQSDGPMDLGGGIGGLIGQMMQQQMQAQQRMMMQRGGMQQRPSAPPFMQIQRVPVFDMMDDDDIFEDPFEIIQEMEAQRRRPPSGFFGMGPPPVYHQVEDDHAMELVQDKVEKTANVAGAHNIHNDVASHSPLYIFACVMLIAALGFFLWYTTAKDLIMGKKKGGEPEQRDITLTSFNKRQ